MDMDISGAIALLEYLLRNDPTATFRLTCNQCRRESLYNYEMLLDMMPAELHPVPLPLGIKWAVLLLEIPTADTMPQQAFFGERVLIENVREKGENWAGYLVSESQFAPSLRKKDLLVGQVLNGYCICTGLYFAEKVHPLPFEELRSGLDFGSFFLPKTGATAFLQCANLTCPNPACAHYFGLTYKELEEILSQRVQHKETQFADGTIGHIILKCEICQSSCVADMHSFNGLFRM